MKRIGYLIAAGMLVLTTVPAFAQGNGNGNGTGIGNNSGNGGCTQTTAGGGGATTGGSQRTTPNNSAQVLTGVIDAAVQDVQALNNIDAAVSALNGSPIQAVCLNDALNQNDLRILQDVLNGSPILSNDLNNSLNNNSTLNGLLQNSDISVLSGSNVQVVAVDLGTGQVFLLR